MPTTTAASARVPPCWSAPILKFPEFETTSAHREHAAHARDGRLTLQTCGDCGAVQYPSRDVCRQCLSGELSWSEVPPGGRVISSGIVHASLHQDFRERAPWRICSVLLDAGPVVIAHVPDDDVTAGDIVDVHDRIVGALRSVLIATRPVERVERERQ
ncbi:MAG TPA: zinc ribbon domain-containing protein [Woeseiaceae bacterium]|nr:zinc ribbon domain-containing protein [Woeseiaceae bacterium]